jgi:DNA-binding CsgD family transcriptional regulator
VASVAFYHEAISLMDDRRDDRVVLEAIEGTALAAVAWNQPEQAARMLGAAAALGERLGYVSVVATDRAAHERTLATLRQAVGEERFRAAWSEGRHLSIDGVIGIMLAMSPPSEREAAVRDRSGTSLSPREREVLQHLMVGDSDREIAARLYLSVRTVEGHVTRLREKFGVRTRTAVVTAALAAGLADAKGMTNQVSAVNRESGVRP